MPDPGVDYLRVALPHLRQRPDRALSVVAVELALALADPGADFGAMVRRNRERAGWSIPDLAVRSGLSENTIRNIEGGRTTPAQESMARLLGVPELQLGVADHTLPPGATLRPNIWFTTRYDPTAMTLDLRAVVNGPGGTLEQSYLYLDNQSAADYLAVCEAYGALRGNQFAELQRLGERVAREGKLVDVIAIGSGDGRAEVCLTQGIASAGAVGKLYLLDISHSLLAHAHEHATAVLHPQGVEVEVVHGNFHKLQRYSMLHAGPGKPRRLYTLLGATLANLADELRFFRDLHSCSAAGDLLLVDYQVAHNPPEDDPTLKAGAIPKIFFDWHSGPLMRNNPQVRTVKMSPQLGPGRMAGSYIIASVAMATLADGSVRSYRMMNSARYTPAVLAEVLTGAGWETIHSTAYDARTAAMLLKRV